MNTHILKYEAYIDKCTYTFSSLTLTHKHKETRAHVHRYAHRSYVFQRGSWYDKYCSMNTHRFKLTQIYVHVHSVHTHTNIHTHADKHAYTLTYIRTHIYSVIFIITTKMKIKVITIHASIVSSIMRIRGSSVTNKYIHTFIHTVAESYKCNEKYKDKGYDDSQNCKCIAQDAS